jgi:CheY-like chemotaxis protein/HPt (histidine-containing phosphotransfer) domain-containing protein
MASTLAGAPPIQAAMHTDRLILVVDDHPTNRRLLVRQLAWLGYAADAAANGRQALQRFAERRAVGTDYALVITDCQMPEMDGYELARRIRAIERGAGNRTVLIAFTANTLREAADECYAAGMDDLLTKPIELKELQAKLGEWLPAHEASARLPLPPFADPARAVSSAEPEARDEPETSLTGEFCMAHDADMATLRGALRKGRHDAVARAAHRIKGAALMYGDATLAEAAAQLENIARAGGGWESTEAAARRVDEQTDRLFAHTGWPHRRRSA